MAEKTNTNPSGDSVKKQSKQVRRAINKHVKGGDDIRFLDPGVFEYVIISQAKLIAFLKKTVFALIGSLVIALVVIFVKQDPEIPVPTYFASYPDGGLKEIIPLSKPLTNTVEMRSWAETCALESLELSFTHKLTSLNDMLQRCFDLEGKGYYSNWLLVGKSSEKIKIEYGNRFIDLPSDSEYAKIIAQKISMSAAIISPARIKEMSPVIVDGESIARWEMQLPVVIKKTVGVESRGFANYIVRLELKRTNDHSMKKGVAISRWTLTRS